MKNTENLHHESHHVQPSNWHIKDKWNTKEYTGLSMKSALWVLQYAKRRISEVNEKI